MALRVHARDRAFALPLARPTDVQPDQWLRRLHWLRSREKQFRDLLLRHGGRTRTLR